MLSTTFHILPTALSFLALNLILQAAAQQNRLANVLIYSATAEYRHESIPTAIRALKANGPSIDVIFEDSEDRSVFNDNALANYDALVFLSNTGEVLDESGKVALQNYLNRGGNFIAIHSASDCLRNTTVFVKELGARFDYHADLQEASVLVTGPPHPSTEGLPNPWVLEDEWYYFESDPRFYVADVVLTVDETSFTNTGVHRFNHGSPHPIAWFQESGAGTEPGNRVGRSFYTSLGHLSKTWEDPIFLSHVLGGIRWALQSNQTRAFNPDPTLVGNPNPDPLSGVTPIASATLEPSGSGTTSVNAVTSSGSPTASESSSDSSGGSGSVLGLPLGVLFGVAVAVTFFA